MDHAVHSRNPRPVVLVTGGVRRLGAAIATELAAAGWAVALHTRAVTPEAEAAAQTLARQHATRVALLAADLADDRAVDGLLARVVQALGRVDAVVNNASRFTYDTALDANAQTMHAHWRVNVAAPVRLAQTLAAHLAERNAQGCVVNLLDQKLWNPNPDYFSYTLSKAALREATVLQAQALAPRVRLVGVAPGVTLPSGGMSQAEFDHAHRMTPLGASSTPADVARTVRFALESPAITGTTLLVDGGQHLQAQGRDVWFLARPA
ncbi:MAG: SDR family oxidoreductase [Proteobacteria bacterium]|nr:SDR family oxidoreductase [Pseudomonadota bacterium]